MKRFIHNLFDEPHFSRADVACDILDLPDDFIRQYRIVDPVSFKLSMGQMVSWKQPIGEVGRVNDKFAYIINYWSRQRKRKLFRKKLILGGV